MITGGGTAGHITPLLAVISELKKKRPDPEVRYIGQFGDRFTTDLINNEANIDKSYSILAGKLRRFHGKNFIWYLRHFSLILRNFRDLLYVFIGTIQSIVIMIIWRPNVIFVKGGFVGLPVGLAGALLHIPIITHDSDAVPGLTNRILSRFATIQAVALRENYYFKYYNRKKVVTTGVPIDRKYCLASESQKMSLKASLGIEKKNKLITIVGGSLGAERLNKAILDIVPLLNDKSAQISLIWSTGKYSYKQVQSYLSGIDLNINIELNQFFNNLDQVFRASDLVISRAGATTMAELAAVGAPTILVPNPILTGGHQTINAKALEDQEACLVVSEKELDRDNRALFDAIDKVLNDTKLQNKLSTNINKIAVRDSASKLADLIIENLK